MGRVRFELPLQLDGDRKVQLTCRLLGEEPSFQKIIEGQVFHVGAHCERLGRVRVRQCVSTYILVKKLKF